MRALLAGMVLFACATTPPRQEVAAPAPRPQATPDADFRQKPPPPGPPVEFKAPVPRQLKLRNGLQVFLVERHEVPLVSVVLAVRSGADSEPRGKAGLASMALEMLGEGTPTRDAAAVARDFEDLAARYRTQTDADASAAGVTALAATVDKVLEVFSDVVLHPVFRDGDVERIRVERLGAIAQTLDDPASVAQRVLARILFGEQHPWGFPAEGTVQSVKAITRKELADWHQAHFQPGNAALFVVGDTDEASLTPLLEKSFGAWKESKAPPPVARKAAQSGARTIYVVDKPDAPQSQIWIGEIGVSSTAQDVFPVRVMNNILGGSFNSRLNGNLRTEHAYSYGVFSFFDTHREAGPFAAAGGVVSEKTAEALGEFIKELEKMKSGEVSDAELSDAKESLVRAIPALFISVDATAVAYARAWAHGLPADYYATYQARVQAVGKEDVAKAARDRLHPDRMAIVVVGPRKAIEERISALRMGKVELRDANGEALKAVKAAAKAGK